MECGVCCSCSDPWHGVQGIAGAFPSKRSYCGEKKRDISMLGENHMVHCSRQCFAAWRKALDLHASPSLPRAIDGWSFRTSIMFRDLSLLVFGGCLLWSCHLLIAGKNVLLLAVHVSRMREWTYCLTCGQDGQTERWTNLFWKDWLS